MKKVIFLSVLTLMLISGCKKREPLLPPTPTPPASPPEYTSFRPCYGFFTTTTYKNDSYQPGPNYTAYDAQVSFSKNPRIEPDYDFLKVNKVSLNNDSLTILKDASGIPVYYWSDQLSVVTKQIWHVEGANGIPSFEFDNTIAMPTADFTSIPDTLRKKFPAIAFSVSNFTRGILIISNYQKGGESVQIYLNQGRNYFVLTPEQLAILGTGDLQIFILIKNHIYKEIEGKNFEFSKTLYFVKQVAFIE